MSVILICKKNNNTQTVIMLNLENVEQICFLFRILEMRGSRRNWSSGFLTESWLSLFHKSKMFLSVKVRIKHDEWPKFDFKKNNNNFL